MRAEDESKKGIDGEEEIVGVERNSSDENDDAG